MTISCTTLTRGFGSCVALGLVLTLLAGPARAQRPTAAQASDLLRNTALAEQVRERLRASGMTPDQIRARLRAGGYPESLLDAYLGSQTPAQTTAPSQVELAAIQALGLPAIDLRDSLPLDTGFIRLRGGDAIAPSRVFGVDAFRRATTQFLPLLSGPVPPDYLLGPGDNLVLILTGDVEFAYTLPVTREGFILIPQVGQVFVSNLNLEQLREVLYARLGRVYSGVRRGVSASTRFDITVANVRANQLYVVGEVMQPGSYQISALGTVLTALYAAGGITERANMRGVEIQRAGKTVATLDLYDYLLRGIARGDIRLETGDVVFVPVHGTRAQVTGAVIRPAVYELRSTETLSDLIRAAGGFRADAALRRIAVHRILPASERVPAPAPRAVVDVPLSPIASRTDPGDGSALPTAPADVVGGVIIPGLRIEDGDSVVVDSIPSLTDVYHTRIAGAVNKPGAYPWREGMTLRDLVALARGPGVGAYLNEAEIARLPTDRTKGDLATTLRVPLDSTYLFERDSSGRYIGPPGLPFPGPGAPEVGLQPFDNVLIFRQPDFELQRTVTIQGEVRYPGVYTLRNKADQVSALVERAGGLTPEAYPEGVQFFRPQGNAGRINLELRTALRDPQSRHNLVLQPGDSVFVPEYLPTVRVTGAVNSPGSVLHRPGEGLGYYIGAAGGLASSANGRRVSVRYANGETRTKSKFLFFASSPAPGPGAEVFVPTRDPSDRGVTLGDVAAVFGTVAQVMASTVAIIVVATR